jgi:hypothetical protein
MSGVKQHECFECGRMVDEGNGCNCTNDLDDEPGHTPGPWKLSLEANFITAGIVICENIAPTCPKTGEPEWTPVHEANARLIAAAPDLLEALEIAADCMRTSEETGDDGESDACIAMVLEVIAKAKAAT